MYTDPTGKLYSTLGMIKTLSLGTAPKYIEEKSMLGLIGKAIWKGLTWGSPIGGGDIRRVGGEFLFVNGEVGWCHRMKTTRDHVEVDELKKVMGLDN